MIRDTLDKVYGYYNGYVDAIRDYAIYQNGEQFIGVMQQPLKVRLKELEDAMHREINHILAKEHEVLFNGQT